MRTLRKLNEHEREILNLALEAYARSKANKYNGIAARSMLEQNMPENFWWESGKDE